MSLTVFRETVATLVAEALGLDTDRIVAGRVDGPVERNAVVCAWSTGKAERGDDANLEDMEVIVRVLFPFSQPKPGGPPPDPQPLEQAIEDVQEFTHQSQLAGGPWFWRPVECAIDVDSRVVEFRCVGVQYNQFAQT